MYNIKNIGAAWIVITPELLLKVHTLESKIRLIHCY